MPQDFSVGFGAEVEQQAKAFDQLRTVLILALILVYAVMASQYESLRDPFIIMFSVPDGRARRRAVAEPDRTPRSTCRPTSASSCSPASWSATASCSSTTPTSCGGATACRMRKAVEMAGRTRLRPILMTSIATALGLVPMSLGIGEGSELQVPLGAGGDRRPDDVAADHARAGPVGLHALRRGLARETRGRRAATQA